ncbi:hypothetical protein [Tannerella forsythia]|nr:hypothetical protein [Tannerella forsythia]
MDKDVDCSIAFFISFRFAARGGSKVEVLTLNYTPPSETAVAA